MISEAPAGLFTHELDARLHVSTKDALHQLVNQGVLHRQRLGSLYLYTAAERVRRQEQWATRQAQRQARDPQEEQLRAAIALFYSLLDEQQRRLYAGLESFKRGHGGDRQMAQWLGLDVETVARGRRELLAGEVEHERIRRAGGGRPRAEKKRPIEPTAPLDSTRALAVIRLLKDLARQFETAVIVVTHDEKIIPTFKRIYHIRDGVTHEEAGDGRGFD